MPVDEIMSVTDAAKLIDAEVQTQNPLAIEAKRILNEIRAQKPIDEGVFRDRALQFAQEILNKKRD